MRIAFTIALALTICLSMGSIEHLLKGDYPLLSLLKYGDMFPSQFQVSGTGKSPTNVEGVGVYRFDGDRNILSYNITYYNTGTGKNQTDNYAFDFKRNMTYITSTQLENQCIKRDLAGKIPMNMNLIDFLDFTFNANTTIYEEKYESGHHYITYETDYSSDYDWFLYTMDGFVYSVNGTIGGSTENHAVYRIDEMVFDEYDHIPKICF